MGTISRIKNERMGYIYDDAELQDVVKESRLHPVLVRCGGCRFTAPAQNVEHLMEMIKKSGMDYVRDISVK